MSHEYPQVIYLIPGKVDGEACTVWSDDPAPDAHGDPSEAVMYVKVIGGEPWGRMLEAHNKLKGETK